MTLPQRHGFAPLRGKSDIHGLFKRVPPEEDIGGVLALYNAGWSYAKIADEFDVTEIRIKVIIDEWRQTWKLK